MDYFERKLWIAILKNFFVSQLNIHENYTIIVSHESISNEMHIFLKDSELSDCHVFNTDKFEFNKYIHLGRTLAVSKSKEMENVAQLFDTITHFRYYFQHGNERKM